MSNGTTNENKAELEKELKEVDKEVGDDQSGNPRRDKFTTLHGGGESAESSPSTTSTTSTGSTTDTTE